MEWNMIATKKMRNPLDIIGIWVWVWVNTYRYIFSGMNIHLPAILGFTRYQGFDPSPYLSIFWGSLTQLQKDHAQLPPMSLHPGPTKVRISWRVSRSTQRRRIATVNTWEIRQVLFDTLMGYSTFAIGYCIILGLLGVFLCFSLFFFEVRNLEQINVSFQPVGGSLDTFCLHVGSLSQPCSTCFWSFNMLNETKIIGNHQKNNHVNKSTIPIIQHINEDQ